MNRGLLRLSVTLLERAAELAGEHRALRTRAICLINLAATTGFVDVGSMLDYSRLAVVATREIGEDYMFAFAQSNLASGLMHAGSWDEALAASANEDVLSHMALESDFVRRLIAMARGEQWPALAETVDEDLATSEDPGERASYLLNSAIEALAAEQAEATTLALSSVQGSEEERGGAEAFWFNWPYAAEIAREQGQDGAIAELLGLVDGQGPYPPAVLAQRSRLKAVQGQDGSLSAEEIEQAYAEALSTIRSWGSAHFVAHISADFGSWLVSQGREEEGAALIAEARDFYQGVGAARWLNALA
jgi:hypothetical protein